jgi:glycosyltransferase involved in cell wall biosynthesis
MRVLTTTDTIGGVWTFTKELSAELLAEGCSVALASLGRMPSAAQQAWVDAQSEHWGSRFCYFALDVPLEWMAENARAFSQAESRLLEIADEFGAELVLSSQFCFGALGCDLPRIVVAHSDVLSWAEACRPDGLARSEWLDKYCELVSRGLREADAVAAPTRWMLDALGAHFRLPAEQAVIANGRTVAQALGSGKRTLQAVAAGRVWDEAKNLRIVRAVKWPMPLLIAGETEHESVRFDSNWDAATLLGRLNEDQLLDLFRSSAIYVCTSIYEPFGLAPLEAALCGCALVANDIPSLREVWGDFALFYDSAESLSELLALLTRDQDQLRRAQEQSSERARRFTAKKMAAGYLQLMQSVLLQRQVPNHAA